MANQLGNQPGGVELAVTPGETAGSGGGSVNSVTATSPVTSTGGTDPVIAITTIPVNKGGTGAVTAAAARTSLDVQQHTAALDAVSGTNTGDQTITLTGDVTGSGTGSFAATIGNDKVVTAKILDANVTLAKMANLDQSTMIGRAAGAGTGVPTALTSTQVAAILGLDVNVTKGTNLTNANQTLTVAGGNSYQQVTALTASRTKTLGVTGSPTTGEIIRIIRTDGAAFTLVVVDDAATTLYTFPVSVNRAADFRYDGTHFVLAGHCAVTAI